MEIKTKTMTVTLIRIASYGRPPRWRAKLTYWPSIDAVEFDMDAEPRHDLLTHAKQLLAESERKCAVD